MSSSLCCPRRLKTDPLSTGGFHGEFERPSQHVGPSGPLCRGEHLSGCSPPEDLAGTVVELLLDRRQVSRQACRSPGCFASGSTGAGDHWRSRSTPAARVGRDSASEGDGWLLPRFSPAPWEPFVHRVAGGGRGGPSLDPPPAPPDARPAFHRPASAPTRGPWRACTPDLHPVPRQQPRSALRPVRDDCAVQHRLDVSRADASAPPFHHESQRDHRGAPGGRHLIAVAAPVASLAASREPLGIRGRGGVEARAASPRGCGTACSSSQSRAVMIPRPARLLRLASAGRVNGRPITSSASPQTATRKGCRMKRRACR